MERLQSLCLEERKWQQRNVPVKYSLSAASSQQGSFALQVLLDSLVLPGQMSESNWEETWKTWSSKGSVQACISFAAHFPSFPAPGTDNLPQEITHGISPSLCKLWKIPGWEFNHEQPHLLILPPPQLCQGTDTHCTPSSTVCILFSTGEFQ